MTAFVYLTYDQDGALLYVGCTADVGNRMMAHRAQSEWFPSMSEMTARRYATRERALAVEARAIRLLSPQYNRGQVRQEIRERRLWEAEIAEKRRSEEFYRKLREDMERMEAEFADQECPRCGAYGFGCYECTPNIESREPKS